MNPLAMQVYDVTERPLGYTGYERRQNTVRMLLRLGYIRPIALYHYRPTETGKRLLLTTD